MKRFFLTIFLVLAALTASAQSIDRLGIEFRGDWQFDSAVAEPSRMNHSAFQAKFANFRIDGTMGGNWSYSFRYRMNKVQNNPFAATDWATVNYSTDKWDFSAGKQVVAIGGYEYDRAPIDIYFASEYWQHIACYQFGASATYKFGNSFGSKILGQVCQSPYDFAGDGLYAYNLMYIDSHSLSSVNMLEYAPGKYIGYLALGIREEFGDVAVEFDVMDRFDFGNGSSSFSMMLDAKWTMNEDFNIFAHGSYDENRSEIMMDPTVRPGTAVCHLGGGVEYSPAGRKDLRFHAATSYVFGQQGRGGVLAEGAFMFQMGLTWRINLLSSN